MRATLRRVERQRFWPSPPAAHHDHLDQLGAEQTQVRIWSFRRLQNQRLLEGVTYRIIRQVPAALGLGRAVG